MPAPLSREREWDELVRANQALQRKYSVARDENDLLTAKLYKKRWNRQQERMRAFLAGQRPPATRPLG
jgi:hypothetical protein